MGLSDIFKIGKLKAEIEKLKADNDSLYNSNQNLRSHNEELHNKLNELGSLEYYKIKEMTAQLEKDYKIKLDNLMTDYENQRLLEESNLKNHISTLEQHCSVLSNKETSLNQSIEDRSVELSKLTKTVKTQTNKLSRLKELIKAIDYALIHYFNYEPSQNAIKMSDYQINEIEELSPSIILKLHCMDVKDLRKAYRENDKLINKILEQYASRYTTKANQAIYKLMVIALRAELQNVLYNLKYEKLDQSIKDIKSVTQKYLKIAGEGNQSIAGTLNKFIGEIEYLFTNAVKIEYNYYVKKEQAKQEQLAIREQMRQEAEERKALETERKKVEQEELKYNSEIQKLKGQLESARDNELEKLNARILELQKQLSAVEEKKEEISNLANGKAGNVYIISNLGSFGENMFKVGMTRRLNPQERVNELGDASVPFKFDVHSFIFSNDAVSLESKLHNILSDKRVNKVNPRKEFFYTNIDELEKLVTKIEPTAEFNKTMLAEEYRQSLSSDTLYTSDWKTNEDSNDNE